MLAIINTPIKKKKQQKSKMWFAVVAYSSSVRFGSRLTRIRHKTYIGTMQYTPKKKAHEKKNLKHTEKCTVLLIGKPESMTTVKHHLFNFRIKHRALVRLSSLHPWIEVPIKWILNIQLLFSLARLLSRSLWPIVSGSRICINISMDGEQNKAKRKKTSEWNL